MKSDAIQTARRVNDACRCSYLGYRNLYIIFFFLIFYFFTD